jgi:multiple sugar transport system ATP-binding protein
MSEVALKNISKFFPGVAALQDVSFEIGDGEFFVLLGPTGAGKTTTLRIIAGLEKQDKGTILFDNQPIDDFTPADRDVAFVFQQYSLYPTMTVFDNLAFPLRSPLRKVPKNEIERRVGSVAETLRINHLLQRRCSNLSGGEMQRVSIGRAIVREPRLFLMDEPLSNLDAKLREALRVELQHLQRTQGSTTLFVTHDQTEALTMADRIGVLNEGRLIQVGKPEEIYDQPATTFVARLVGTPRINVFEAAPENGRMMIQDSELHLATPGTKLPASFLVGIRPEDVDPDPDGPFSGRVILTEPLGVETILHIQSGRKTIISLVAGMTDIQVGQSIRFSITEERLHLFDTDGLRISGRL